MFATAAMACTCSQAPPGKCPGLHEGDVVFLGTVTAVEDIPYTPAKSDDPSDPPAAPVDTIASRLTRYHFHIDEKFAGPDEMEVDIYAGGDDGDCAYRFKQGQQYLVFTQEETGGRLFATICNGTRPGSEAIALIPQLRAMRNGTHVASVFGILRRADPPFLAPPGDPDDPVPNVSLKLRSYLDRFETSTDASGVYSFYDVHAGVYAFTANLPPRTQLTQKTLAGELPPFQIPDGACFEYNVDALPTGHIRGSVLGANGKPLPLASVELYRAGSYADSQPGLWAFQGGDGYFDFDHIGSGDYVMVFNRMNRHDPNSPYPRSFYPGVPDIEDAQAIHLNDGQQLAKVNLRLKEGFPTRKIRVHLQWEKGRPPGTVTVMAKADKGRNPAATKIGDGLYEFTLLESSNYTISAWEDLARQRGGQRAKDPNCQPPSRIDAASVSISGADGASKELLLVFPAPGCAATN
ncbi:MAG TPA: hypothetical protein VMB02_14860 [Candidatus Aquilonibacter sp.]|nr:hypothetical protein [Candidatus Aquilonibacter sp.]